MRISRPQSQRGFTLLEVLLAIGVSLSIGGVALTELQRTNASQQARAVGQQAAMVGRALNTYVALRYHTLINLEEVDGVGDPSDPGPRYCTPNAGTMNGNPFGICTITTDTLIRSGLLPTSFSGRNAFGADYHLYIRVMGSSPNWIVEGLAVTDQPYTTGGGNRYDLLGQAMQEAGADSGMTRTLTTTIEGLNGTWRDNSWPSVTHNGITYPGVNQLGLLGVRAGYGTSGYAAYLRLDGSTPMTGNLDMDSNDIVDVGTITAQHGVFQGTGTEAAISINATTPANRTDLMAGAGTLALRNANGFHFENLDGSAGGNVQLGQLTASSSITADGDISTDQNLSAGAGLTVAGNASVGGTMGVTGALTAGSVSTTNNGNITATGTGAVIGYRLEGSQAVLAGGLAADANGYRIDSSGIRSRSNASNPYWFYDSVASTPAWRTTGNVQVDQNLRTNNLDVDTISRFGGRINMTGSYAADLVTVNTACNSSFHAGQLRRTTDANAPIVTCSDGLWRRLGTGQTSTANSATVSSPGIGGGTVLATASCPTGTRVVGGGYVLVSFLPLGGGYDGNAPSQSYPNGSTGWTIALDQRTGNSSFQARAVCAY